MSVKTEETKSSKGDGMKPADSEKPLKTGDGELKSLKTVSGTAATADRERSLKLPLPTGEIPSAERQRQIITSLEGEEESVHVYCISKQWYENWQRYVGLHESGGNGSSGHSNDPTSAHQQHPHPGPLTMDAGQEDAQEERNTYIDEKIWKKWLKWFGVADSHELDRRNWASDDKAFEVCALTPYSGVVQHPLKTLDVSEVTGYVELQLRKLLGVSAPQRDTRLWMCERQRSARFSLVLDRSRQLCQQDGFDPKKEYILALEERGGGVGGAGCWPTHVAGEPLGGDLLEKYRVVTEGPKSLQYWEEELATAVQTVFSGIAAELNETVAGIVSTSRCLTAGKERELGRARDKVDLKLRHIGDTQRVLDSKYDEASRYENLAREEAKSLKDERERLDGERRHFELELRRMEELNKTQETRVRLDIGGHVYTTSTLTLTRDPGSMLAAMFSGRHALKKEADGSYFVDRDGTHFRYVLNYLRDGGFREGTLPTDPLTVNELITEAEYYQLKGLVELLMGTEEKGHGSSGDKERTAARKPQRKIALRK